MFSTPVIPTLIYLALSVAVAAHPAPTLEPNMAADYPFPMPTPLIPPSSIPLLLPRQWEWASIPAWYNPSPPSPTSPTSHSPSSSEHKNTLTHEIIAAIIVGIFVGCPILGCLCVAVYRRCWVKRAKRKGAMERGRTLTRDGERKRVFTDGDYVTRLTERPDMVYWAKERR